MINRKIFLRRSIYHFINTINPLNSGIKIICYHDISPKSWRFSVSPVNFEKQIRHIATNSKFISSAMLQSYLSGKSNYSGFLITFDDGYQSIFDIRQIVNQFYFKPVVFLLSDTQNVDRNQLNSEISFLNKEQIYRLHQDGWEFGSHSATHPDFSSLNDNRLKSEIIDSKKMLEDKYQIPINYFAYPRGVYNPIIKNMVESAGYSLAFSMDDSVVSSSSNPLILPRIGIDHSHDFEEFKAACSDAGVSFRHFVKSYAPSLASI